MKRVIPLSLIGSAIFMCLSAGAGQAAVVSSANGQLASSMHASTIVSDVGWRHHRRHCWWHHHRRHCRYHRWN
jgi:hypothetical protein